MFHGRIKYSTEGVKHSMEYIPGRGLNIPRGYQRFHGGGKILDGGIKYSTEGVKHSRVV